MDPRRLFGNRGERLAERYLKKNGIRVIARQYRTRYGEIDLVAKDGDEVVFVEVKARRTSDFGHPEAAVTRSKLRKIAAAGRMYMHQEQRGRFAFRIDVVAIEFNRKQPKVTHLKNVGLD